MEPARPTKKAEPPPPAPLGSQPDPEPLRISEQWQYELEWNAGQLGVISTTPRVFPKPIVTARKMGRFAVELWIGAELVERVRFDFPLLAADEQDYSRSARAAPPSLEKGARVRTTILVPNAPRARRAVLVDRATNETLPLEWPPPVAPASGG